MGTASENTGTEDQKTDTPIKIKKYPNRRLYDTSSSSYIVLDDIVALVKAGTEFIIEDTKTGEDITRSILSQVIFEREADQSNYHFPLDVQKQLISMYDDAYSQMVPDYLRESMNVFVTERDRMKNTFQEIVETNSRTMAQFNENLAKQNLEIFNRSFEFFQSMAGFGQDSWAQEKSVDEPDEKTDNGDELEDIQAKINELQERLKNVK